MSISIPKNKRDDIRVRLRDFKGERYVDVRVFFLADSGTMKPSGKGVAVRVDLADALADAIRQVAAQERVDDD